MSSSKDSEQVRSTDTTTEVSYEGNCHCKAVLYTVNLSAPVSQLPVVSCNCSYCHVSGALHVSANDIEIRKGTESLKEYEFGSHTIKMFFCGTCGANVYNRSVNPKFNYGKCAINARLLQGVDLEAINVTKRDGKNFSLPPLEEKL